MYHEQGPTRPSDMPTTDSASCRLLVFHGGGLGDCVLALHVADQLREEWKLDGVATYARSGIAAWACRHELIEGAGSWEDPLIRGIFVVVPGPAGVAAPGLVRPGDVVLSFLGDLSDVPGIQRLKSCGQRVFSVDPRLSARTSSAQRHITHQWLEDIAAQCSDPDLPSPPLPTREGTRTRQSRPLESRLTLAHERRTALRVELRARLGVGMAPIAICHPGSGGQRKCFPLELWRGIRGLLDEHGWRVVWMVGPDEVERDGPAMIQRLRASAPILFEESLVVAADRVAGCDLFLGHDAGMTHVAALAGVPTLALFGPTDPRVWGPIGPRTEVFGFPPAAGPLDEWLQSLARRAAELRWA